MNRERLLTFGVMPLLPDPGFDRVDYSGFQFMKRNRSYTQRKS